MVSTLTFERGSKLLSGFFNGKEFAYSSLRNPHGCLRHAPYCHLLKGSPLEGFDLCSFGGEEAEGTVMGIILTVVVKIVVGIRIVKIIIMEIAIHVFEVERLSSA